MQRGRGKYNPRASSRSPPPAPVAATPGARAEINRAVRGQPTGEAAWLHKPEIPTAAEVANIVNGCLDFSEAKVEGNRERGGWATNAEYLETQYNLLRQDSVLPLARAVQEVRASPIHSESTSYEKARIYDEVYFSGLTITKQGFAIKTEFSTNLVEKKIGWAQSKRLKTGTIVALTPEKDRFRSVCIVAVVASRPVSSVEVPPPAKPAIHLYFADIAQIEIEPQVEYIMVEGSNGYWESSRHVLKALQCMSDESFPMSEHIVDVQPTVPVAKNVTQKPFMNLSDSFGDGFESVNVLKDWPSFAAEDQAPATTAGRTKGDAQVSTMDKSQMQALRRLLAKRLAVVQGPPGTGKTFVSVQALRAFVQDWREGDPPIIVAAHTNHALDQLLRHVNTFEPGFVRLGGQTTDKDVIEPRTIFNLRRLDKDPPTRDLKHAYVAQRSIGQTMAQLLEPLLIPDPISPELLLQFGIITNEQCESFSRVERQWVSPDDEENDTPMAAFCEDSIKPFEKLRPRRGFDHYEDVDDDEEQRPEEDSEAVFADDDRIEELKGPSFAFCDGWTTKKHFDQSDVTVRKALKTHRDVSKIDTRLRGATYSYCQREVKARIRDGVRRMAHSYVRTTKDFQAARFETDHLLLKKNTVKIVGTTTTGLSKYRGLLSSLEPRIMLIEEAAETLEAYITAGCLKSVQQLLLVGDHQQLRPRCTMPEHAGGDVNLDLSMFERLVNNGIEMQQLKTQRRMHTEIRRLISPIYPDLVDHPSVKSRAHVRGMGPVACHFFHHEWPEAADDALSKRNLMEATMIEAFYKYLDQNENHPQSVTVMTFYNGQKKLLRKLLSQSFPPSKLKIVTVDSYQGEENEVAILSTVRNNKQGQIGFLDDVHRVCVALSRARRGFYIFGNGQLLSERNHKWHQIIINVVLQHSQLETFMPLFCEQHGNLTKIEAAVQFGALDGGCMRSCKDAMHCGHSCGRRCHYTSHDELPCLQPCTNFLSCGHRCTQHCSEYPCRCDTCEKSRFNRERNSGFIHAEEAPDPDLERCRLEAAQWGGGPYAGRSLPQSAVSTVQAQPRPAPGHNGPPLNSSMAPPTPSPRYQGQSARPGVGMPGPMPNRHQQPQRREADYRAGARQSNQQQQQQQPQRREAEYRAGVRRSDQQIHAREEQQRRERRANSSPNAATVETLNVRDLTIRDRRERPVPEAEEDLIDFGEDANRPTIRGGSGSRDRKVFSHMLHM